MPVDRETVTAALERETQLRQWRCPRCGARLFDANIMLSAGELIEAYCRSCRRVVTFAGQPAIDDNEDVA